MNQAFSDLKRCFISAPIQPNPLHQFIQSEVDAPVTGVGEVLFQCSILDQKLHSCIYVSCCLSPTERSPYFWNHKLLAVKLTLEEWRHWLEGAEHPFIAWTDHKNLTYIQTAKCLNSCQACWVLVFGCFNFTLTYHPSLKNGKPGALSHRSFLMKSLPILTLSSHHPVSWLQSPGRLNP